MPPRDAEQRNVPRTAGAAAAAGVATGAAGAPVLAAPAAAGLAGIGTLAVIGGAAAAAITKQLVDVIDQTSEERWRSDEEFLLLVLPEAFPGRPQREIRRVVDREAELEQEFRRRMRDRLRRDLPKALAVGDPTARVEAVRRILEREKRYTRMREEAMLNRAIARMETNLLMEQSPEGAFWKLSPNVREHTIDCLAMGGKFWPWEVLERIHPPMHAGCPCELWGLGEAVEAGLMSPAQVPDRKDAIRRANRLIKEIDELRDAVGEEEIEEAVAVLTGIPMELLAEAREANTGAMVALYPEPSVAKALAQDGGERWQDIHLTLAFLGKADKIGDQMRLRKLVEGFAASAPPLAGEVSGLGIFTAGPKPVTYASADVPGLNEWRDRLVDSLARGGFEPSADHGFTPHLTLSYDARPDAKLPNRKLRFRKVALVLGERRYWYDLKGEAIEEAKRGHRDPLRWARGFAKGGQFRPERGGMSARVLRKVRGLMSDGPELGGGGERGGRWTWVAGTYTRVPEADAWERKVAGRTYRSPAGSTNVYRDGKLVSEPGVASLPSERAKPSPGALATASEATHRLIDRKRAERRAAARERISQASTRRAPVRRGDGAEALLSLPHEGFELRRAVPTGVTDIETGRRGSLLEFRRGDAELKLAWDGEEITDIEWRPVAAPRPVRAPAEGVPRDIGEFRSDVLAWVDETAMRFNAPALLDVVEVDPSLFDHAGTHDWTGVASLGRDVPGDIERAAAARAAGRELSDDERRGVWSSYWVAAHEALGHGVNPIQAHLYQEDAHGNLEEALAEEAAHVLAAERLTETGQLDVLDWRARNPTHPAVAGNYRIARHGLSLLFDEAGLIDFEERRAFLMELAFETPPEARFDRIAERVSEATGGELEETRERAVALMSASPARTEGFGGGRPVLVFERSPGRRQMGLGYGRFADGELSPDGLTLTLPNGHVRRVEKLPLVMPELAQGTDGTAVVAYPPGAEPTPGLVLADGSPKNFRYVDTHERAKLILRAFAGKGSPGVAVDPELVRRTAEELKAAKGWVSVDGVPVKRRFDGSFGVGWYDDGRVLSGVAGEENAARIALKRSQESPPWGAPAGSGFALPKLSPGAGGGWTGGLFDDFFGEEPKHSPGAWLKKLGDLFDDPPAPKPPKKKAKPKKEFVGGKKGKVEQGPIPSYDAVRLEVGKFAGGSNGARWAFDAKGNRWLLKTYRGDQDRIATELLSNALYREMGAKVAEAGMIDVKGKPALTYPALEGEVRQYVFKDGGPNEAVGRHFMLDALLANWDFAGMSDDNIMWGPDGEPFRVDQGGTLEFRAQGQRKPFGPVPTEVWTMLRKGQAARASAVTEDEMREQAAAIEATLTPERIDELADAAPFKDAEMRDRVRDALKARVSWMGAFARGEVELPRPLEGEQAAAELMDKDGAFNPHPEQEDSLFGYVEGLDEDIDAHLRSGAKREAASKPVRRAIDELDSIFRAVEPTREDVIAYVGIDVEPATPLEATGEELVGKSLEERGYLKATLDPAVAGKYAAVLRLVIPEGSHLLYTPALGYDDMPAEPELLLARGAKLRIGARKVVDGKLHFDTTVSTQKPFKPWTAPPKKPKKPKQAGEGKPPTGAMKKLLDDEEKGDSIWDDIGGKTLFDDVPPKASPGTGGPFSPGAEPTEADVRELFEGDYGNFEVRVTRVRDDSGFWSVDGEVVRDGRPVGIFNRLVSGRGGAWTVYNENFQLDRDARGQGIARQFLRETAKRMRDAGVSNLTVHAEDEGATAWAKLGFDFDVDEYREIFAGYEELEDLERAPEVEVRHAIRRWLFDQTGRSHEGMEDALTPQAILAVDAKALEGTDWYGRYPLNAAPKESPGADPEVWETDYTAYVAGLDGQDGIDATPEAAGLASIAKVTLHSDPSTYEETGYPWWSAIATMADGSRKAVGQYEQEHDLAYLRADLVEFERGQSRPKASPGTVTTAQVRSVLKKAGLTPAKVTVSKQVKGYPTVNAQGFRLSHETEYRQKKHERTGRVVVEMALSSWNADKEKAASDLATARESLTAAGYAVSEGVSEWQLVVGPPKASPGGAASREFGVASSQFREAEQDYLRALGGEGDQDAARERLDAARDRLDAARKRAMGVLDKMGRSAARELAKASPGTGTARLKGFVDEFHEDEDQERYLAVMGDDSLRELQALFGKVRGLFEREGGKFSLSGPYVHQGEEWDRWRDAAMAVSSELEHR